jgi:hypothetical protein
LRILESNNKPLYTKAVLYEQLFLCVEMSAILAKFSFFRTWLVGYSGWYLRQPATKNSFCFLIFI